MNTTNIYGTFSPCTLPNSPLPSLLFPFVEYWIVSVSKVGPVLYVLTVQCYQFSHLFLRDFSSLLSIPPCRLLKPFEQVGKVLGKTHLCTFHGWIIPSSPHPPFPCLCNDRPKLIALSSFCWDTLKISRRTIRPQLQVTPLHWFISFCHVFVPHFSLSPETVLSRNCHWNFAYWNLSSR